ncbi:MAG TPA: response regulator [Thermotogota bacterium]|nr:response regulator [Thermotogota bacterium]HPJ88014.1 response regulator [Thermotogota bacterium]HPR95101.1 response regulator [Thermotogota bacterium]
MEKTLKILLAEDDLISRRLIKILIDKIGYQITTVENGQQVIEEMKNDDYDLILMDIQMPILDGLEATKKIRLIENEEQLKRIPVIAVTAHAMVGDREKCLSSGMDDYMTKPIEEVELIKKIREYTNKDETLKIGNIDRLSDLLGNMDDVVEIINDFISYYPEQLEKMQSAYDDSDWTTLKDLAHKLKGSVSNFEADQVVTCCKKIEIFAKEGNREQIDREMKKLSAGIEQLKNYLLQQIKK